MLDTSKLRKIYRRYGFTEQKSSDVNILVFSLMAGHYHNVDIIPLDDNADIETVFNEYKASGFACKERRYTNVLEAEEALFRGFFSSDSTQSKFKRDYENFTHSITKLYAAVGNYSYINSKYEINDREGESDVVQEVVSRFNLNKPVLFLIEAAAGFGKTCTAYEILNNIVTNYRQYVPLFTELSRNRQAKIFRYVLLDEIDRSFPTLSSSLVNTEIRNGNVPVILDGFDELLHESSIDNGYENTEPMLETIGELLTDNAKIVLTTRRTAIFDGDEFHQWMDDHENDFEVIRIRIQEPTVTEWLTPDRLSKLSDQSFEVEKLSNPVLLSYLRFITEEEFRQVSEQPEKLVQKYFDSMLERERIRQDLRMKPKEQYEVLKSLAKYMMQLNFTGESREFILEIIHENNHDKLEDIRKEYAAEERPTSDEIANKLASHALLDRSSDESQGIGFVNDFVLGNFCGEIIQEHETLEWVGDKRFIEPSIVSYKPRAPNAKINLWNALRFSMEFADGNEKLASCIALTGELLIDLVQENIEGMKVSSITIGTKAKLSETIFIDCVFEDVTFDFGHFENVTFMNCNFFNCYSTANKPSSIYLAGCTSNNEFLENELLHQRDRLPDEVGTNALSESEKSILEKFWPKGRPTFTKHRPIKGLVALNNNFSHSEILDAIGSLKRRGFLVVPTKRSFLEINVSQINEIKSLLGRVTYGAK